MLYAAGTIVSLVLLRVLGERNCGRNCGRGSRLLDSWPTLRERQRQRERKKEREREREREGEKLFERQ